MRADGGDLDGVARIGVVSALAKDDHGIGIVRTWEGGWGGRQGLGKCTWWLALFLD
jgi:hypothetical protein